MDIDKAGPQQTGIAAHLTQAIKEGTVIAKDGFDVPDLEEAYRSQAQLLSNLGVIQPRGYKFSLREGTVVGAPLLSVSSQPSIGFQPGLKVEVELALTLARDLPPRPIVYTRDEILNALDHVNIGIELVRSRYLGGPGLSLPLLLCDLMSNQGYLVGPQLSKALLMENAKLGNLYLTCGDKVLFDAEAKHPEGDPLAGLIAAASKGLPMGGHLKAGQVVTTGTLCGAPLLEAGSSLSVTFGGASWTLDPA